jgi:SAM-dependent methyltransferase
MQTNQFHQFTEAFWDERYGSTDRVWSGRPNAALVDEAADLPPGTALDVGCGEGADAIWLAGRGWRVTGADVSGVALERAAAHTPPSLAGQITWTRVDLTDWRPDQHYDLVSAQFVLHFPAELHDLRDGLLARLADAVAPGGQLVVVGHSVRDMGTSIPRPPDTSLFFTAEDLAAQLDPTDWRIHTTATRPRPWTHDGQDVLLHDAVLRAQRR